MQVNFDETNLIATIGTQTPAVSSESVQTVDQLAVDPEQVSEYQLSEITVLNQILYVLICILAVLLVTFIYKLVEKLTNHF